MPTLPRHGERRSSTDDDRLLTALLLALTILAGAAFGWACFSIDADAAEERADTRDSVADLPVWDLLLCGGGQCHRLHGTPAPRAACDARAAVTIPVKPGTYVHCQPDPHLVDALIGRIELRR